MGTKPFANYAQLFRTLGIARASEGTAANLALDRAAGFRLRDGLTRRRHDLVRFLHPRGVTAEAVRDLEVVARQKAGTRRPRVARWARERNAQSRSSRDSPILAA